MKIVEKILARASGKEKVIPGEIVECKVDVVMTNDRSGVRMMDRFNSLGIDRMPDPDRLVVIFDHDVPPKAIASANKQKELREFIKKHQVKHYYPMGAGVCHQVLPEKGHVWPGSLVVGTDSHTVTGGAFGALATGVGHLEAAGVLAKGTTWFRVPETIRIVIDGKLSGPVMAKDIILLILQRLGTKVALYKAIEFTGEAVDAMSLDGRMAIANMSVELGAKCGLFAVDQKTFDFLDGRVNRPFTPVVSDPDEIWEETYHFNVDALEPLVACPHNLENVQPVAQVGGLEIHQAAIGTCTGGRLEDMRMAARILHGRRVHPDVRMIITPGSAEIYHQCLEEGIIHTFHQAGAIIHWPGCGICAAGISPVLGVGERCISAQNRNFKGRLGDGTSEIFVASPATVAASAVKGQIADPREFY